MKVPLVDLKWQHAAIEDEVISGLESVMTNTAFIHGPQVAEFEQAFAAFCDVRNCVGVASGTDALEMAVRGLGLGAGDEVIVPANSFIASTLGVIRAGAQVKLVDCDPDTYLIDIDAVDQAIGPNVKAVMPVHLFGQIAPVEELSAIVGDAAIIEDAAQSQGARRNGKLAGSLGQVAATSFYPGKNIGAYGDAGGVLTDDDDLAQRVRDLGNWGSPEKYHHPVVGFNSRLDTMQAVVLSAKLTKLNYWNKLRQEAADRYNELLQARGRVLPPVVLAGNEHICTSTSFECRREIGCCRQCTRTVLGRASTIRYPCTCRVPSHSWVIRKVTSLQPRRRPARCCRSRCSPESRPSSRNS